MKKAKRDFLELTDLTADELLDLLDLAAVLKRERSRGKEKPRLPGKTLAMIFEKPSTRTRVSFEVAICEQGGRAVVLAPDEIQLGRGETIRDTARVLSRYCQGIVLRTFGHERVVELARAASVPVINGLSDLTHPCQILADLLTIRELLGRCEKISVAYIGDGNNVLHSWMMASSLLAIDLRVASPPEYAPPAKVVEEVRRRGGPGS
ncbi:MAG: ornithine carbamoyltransferase, partial [Bdellovibrionota bacterium]